MGDWIRRHWWLPTLVSVVLIAIGLVLGMLEILPLPLTLSFISVGVFLLIFTAVLAASEPRSGEISAIGPLLLIVLAIALLGGATYVIYKDVFTNQPEYQIGILIIMGVCLMLVLLFIVSTGFRLLKLADSNQALGLPEGSIRALIALLLMLIFIIMGVFLFRQAAQGIPTRLISLSASQLADLPKDRLVGSYTSTVTIPTYQIVYVLVTDGVTGTSTITITGTTLDQIARLPPNAKLISQREDGQSPTYDAYIRTEISSAGADMGKQLLTTVGTLVVAVAGFYFGTRAVATARGESAPPEPTISGLYPTTNKDLKEGEPFKLEIHGEDFKSPARVYLSRANQPDIEAANVSIDRPSRILCEFNLANKPAGVWDVVVVNPDGTEARKVQTFTIE